MCQCRKTSLRTSKYIKQTSNISEGAAGLTTKQSHYGVRSEGTAGQNIDILAVMCPAGLVKAAHRMSTVDAAHEPLAEVVCQAAFGPAISEVK